MTRRDDDPSDRPGTGAAAALHHIAEALGCSPETFFQQAEPESDLTSAKELLRLWADLPDSQARRRILSQIRWEVERCHEVGRIAL